MKSPLRFFNQRCVSLRTLAFLLALSVRVAAADYYIDYAAGADANSGTSTAEPWQHCPGDPAAAATASAVNLAPGDVVHFKGGVTYVFTGGTGIALRWNGAPGAPIVYDGNAAGNWGDGRANFTDRHAFAGLAAFSSPSNASHLTFRCLDLGPIGGAATLPPDSGAPAPARFGAGIAIDGTATGLVIEACAFHGLGYTFNQKPMAADSIAGTGLSFRGGSDIAIANSTFAQMAVGIDLTGAASVTNLAIANCTFGEAMGWTLVVPPGLYLPDASISGCTEVNSGQFDLHAWTGYGDSPRATMQTVAEGETVTFRATALATPAPSFQWLRNGVPLAGATDAFLTLSPATLAAAGTYTVVATNSAGATTSNETILLVTPSTTAPLPGSAAPIITTQPVAQVVAPLGTATFSVTATGTPTPTYQWLRNGAPIAGWTHATLVLEGVSTNDLGHYAVVATNAAGTATSHAAALTLGTPDATAPVLTAPVFTTQPVSQSVPAQAPVAFIAAASGNPSPTFQWFRNAAPLAGQTAPVLVLVHVSAADAGTYWVLATNSAGSVGSDNATLAIAGVAAATAPTITLQPVSQTSAPLSTVTFRVAASGSPAPSFQWTRNGVPIAGWTNATLTLEGVSVNDIGQYRAIATNSAGTVTSESATLTLLATSSVLRSISALVAGGGDAGMVAPTIALQPVSQTAAAMSSVTFTVAASGSPAPSIQWMRNGVTFPGWTGPTLTLTGLTSNDAGIYVARVTNTAGVATSQGATLTILPPY